GEELARAREILAVGLAVVVVKPALDRLPGELAQDREVAGHADRGELLVVPRRAVDGRGLGELLVDEAVAARGDGRLKAPGLAPNLLQRLRIGPDCLDRPLAVLALAGQQPPGRRGKALRGGRSIEAPAHQL